MNIIPVILAGGSGSRLWPLSRTLYPKQFLKLEGESTMLQKTFSRMEGLNVQEAIVICNEEHRFIVAEQLRQINIRSDIILEPFGRNTAPAVALAAIRALERKKDDEDPILLVLAADHLIKNEQEFKDAVNAAIFYAESERLVTFGISPGFPETGFGYIKSGVQLDADANDERTAFEVARFVEKPDIMTAEKYLSEGGYYWNSGMFMFKANRYVKELEKVQPEVLSACMGAIEYSQRDLEFIRIDESHFRLCPDTSIDYAVMEQTEDAIVIPLDAGWSDVGSWASLWDISDKDINGNSHHGDIISYYSNNNYIYADSGLVVSLGVDDLVIVQTKDAVLVAKRDAVQSVKEVVSLLKESGRTEHYSHREVYRPWGKYDSIDSGLRYEVKRIEVKPGESISLQMHHHRAEHWIVVSGIAKVRIDEKQVLLGENQSVYIPVGTWHSLENPGRIPLEVVEVRSGSYLAEDDVVRSSSRA